MGSFFHDSDQLDRLALKPLAHIRPHWELTWDRERLEYVSEEDSFADALNTLIQEIARTEPPSRYHDNEDILAEYVIARHRWPIKKVGGRWVGTNYESILEQGGFSDDEEKNLVRSAAGRMHSAIHFGQDHFDKMERGHQQIFAWVIAIILYHRS